MIPCCVFTNIFPERCIDGKQVRTYEDLIAYLLAKDPFIKMCHLPFEGRNQVLYKFYSEEGRRMKMECAGCGIGDRILAIGGEES